MRYLINIFLTFLIFTHQFLFADGEDIGISVNNAVAVTENAGSTSFQISLTEEPDWCDEVVVNYTTQDDSAKAGNDYVSKSGSVTFYGACLIPPRLGSGTSETVSVDIVDDTNYENNERFYLKISNSMLGYVVQDNNGYAFIHDDDTQPLEITPYNTTVTENDGVVQATFNVQLNQPAPSGGVTISYNTYDGSAKAGDDYTQQNSSITIAAGQTIGYIQVPILGDSTEEGQENFYVDLFNPSQGSLTNSTVTGTINDDDRPTVDITSSDVSEGNVGDSNSMEFKIFLAKEYPLTSPLIINYQTQDGSSPSATAGSDYTATSGSVTFNMGEREKVVTVPIIGDNTPEHDENLKMVISGSPYIIDSDSESEILNDDGAFPGVNFATGDFSIVEGNSSSKVLNFNFTLDKDALPNTSFEYYTQDDEAKVADNDYVQIPKTVYHVPVGTRNINIPVTINGDTKIENDELFELKITNEKNINIIGHTAKGNILNDDGSYPEIVFDLPSYSISEGDSGTQDLNVTISLSQPALAGSSFQYKTEHGSAKASQNDYIEIHPTTHTFSGGETTLSIPVKVIGDTNIEGDETFYVKILNGHDVKISGSEISATTTILNDDVAPDSIKNIGEFRFDDCGGGEWKIDHSLVGNDITSGTPAVIDNDGKSYMCTSLKGNSVATIPHHSSYAVDKGTVSMLLYDHHNVWNANSWMFQKGNFKVEIIRVAGDKYKGSLKVSLDGNVIDTQEVFFTNSDGGDFDTQWIHVAVTFGNQGLKLYVNGIEKGSHSYVGGIGSNNDDINLASLSGYYDEFYIFEGQMNAIQVDSLYNNTISDRNIDGTSRDCGCYTSSDPFTCDNSMYISSSTNRQTNATGRMWLHRVDTTQNPFEFEVMEDTGAAELYNATAYNPDDNYIYGLYHRQLVRLTRGAEVTNLGTITGLHPRFDSKQLYAGAIHGGYYYITGRNSQMKEVYKVKLSDLSVTELILSEEVAIQDFSFYKNVNDAIPEGQFLYGIEKDGPLIKIDVTTGTVTRIGSNHGGFKFDSSYSDKNGRFFANDSNGNGFFEFNLQTGAKSLVSNSQSATFNDGANCLNAALVFNDFGDAPASYGTPKHNLANGIFMGYEIDHDVYTFATTDANGDDNDGVDDEDGVILADGSDLNNALLPINTNNELKIKVSKDGYLNAWIDYNIDGDFEDAGEKIFNAYALSTGVHSLNVAIPDGLTLNQMTYIRFRYSSTANLNPTQSANDGEVEDYAIKFKSDVLRGVFNIERTNSETQPINSKARHAWYTQIVERDFNYAVVFYEEDWSSVKIIEDVTFKVELYDNKTKQVITEMAPRYHYVSSTENRYRQPFPATDDLNKLSAYQDVSFRISYASDGMNGIIKAPCHEAPQVCYDNLASKYTIDTSYAKDNFAIRPKYFYVGIHDDKIDDPLKNPRKIVRENNNTDGSAVRLAAGYDYNVSVIASSNIGDHQGSKNYTRSTFIAPLIFKPEARTCRYTKDGNMSLSMLDGYTNHVQLSHHETGLYALGLIDSTWTEVDQNETHPLQADCLMNQADNNHFNTPSGCNIVPKADMNLSFYPYQFGLDFKIHNLPSSGHDDFIYMTDVNSTHHHIAIQLLGSIEAQNKQGNPTKNFTESCMGQTTKLINYVELINDQGNNVFPIKTVHKDPSLRKNVNVARMTRFNDENLSIFSHHPQITSNPIIIDRSKFLDEQNGTVNVELRYNLQKPLADKVNPVQVIFERLEAESTDANSSAEGRYNDTFFPRGGIDMNTTANFKKNFYFARVSSDKLNYPSIFFGHNSFIRTPLNVEIFCQKDKNFCEKLGIYDNTDKGSLSKVYNGWHPSTNHHQQLDGNVSALNHTGVHVTVTPNAEVDFTNGRESNIVNTFADCTDSGSLIKVEIVPQEVLLYDVNASNGGRPYYTISCYNKSAGELSGIGQTGNIIDDNRSLDQSSKMDW